jgi:hypothetical protein
MANLRKYNPYTPRGRRAKQRGLRTTKRKVEKQLNSFARAIYGDIISTLDTYGIKWAKGKRRRGGSWRAGYKFGFDTFHIKTNAEWKKDLLEFHSKEELLNMPMAEIGINASMIIFVSCDYEQDNICAILKGTPDSQFFNRIREIFWADDPDADTKLQMMVDKIQAEALKKIDEFGFVMGEPLLYDISTETGEPLTILPLYDTSGFAVL